MAIIYAVTFGLSDVSAINVKTHRNKAAASDLLIKSNHMAPESRFVDFGPDKKDKFKPHKYLYRDLIEIENIMSDGYYVKKIELFSNGLLELLSVKKIHWGYGIFFGSLFYSLYIIDYLMPIISLNKINLVSLNNNEPYFLFDIYFYLKGLLFMYISKIVLIKAPLTEEYLFRKIILDNLRTKFSWLYSIIYQGMLFSLIHYATIALIIFISCFYGPISLMGLIEKPLIFFGLYFLMGVIFGILTKTINLGTSIVMHGTINMIALLMLAWIWGVANAYVIYVPLVLTALGFLSILSDFIVKMLKNKRQKITINSDIPQSITIQPMLKLITLPLNEKNWINMYSQANTFESRLLLLESFIGKHNKFNFYKNVLTLESNILTSNTNLIRGLYLIFEILKTAKEDTGRHFQKITLKTTLQILPVKIHNNEIIFDYTYLQSKLNQPEEGFFNLLGIIEGLISNERTYDNTIFLKAA